MHDVLVRLCLQDSRISSANPREMAGRTVWPISCSLERGPSLSRSRLQKAVNAMKNHALVERVRSEFIEMPGLRLTPAQAARLWGMDQSACHSVISTLVSAAFLRWTPTGMVVRV
jgi:hypothetical protein